MYKKLVALFMAMIMTFGASLTAFANTVSDEEGIWVLMNSDPVEIEIDGEKVKIPAREYKYVDPNGTEPTGMYPEYEVGEKKLLQFALTNQQMGLPSTIAGTVTLTKAIKKNATKLLEELITKKMGANFIPGLAIASTLLGIIAWVNAEAGYDGFIFSVHTEYSSIFLHKEGYYVYGWDITKAGMKPATKKQIDAIK
jgi:hypothetical protein